MDGWKVIGVAPISIWAAPPNWLSISLVVRYSLRKPSSCMMVVLVKWGRVTKGRISSVTCMWYSFSRFIIWTMNISDGPCLDIVGEWIGYAYAGCLLALMPTKKEIGKAKPRNLFPCPWMHPYVRGLPRSIYRKVIVHSTSDQRRKKGYLMS